jgi:hypothetical protein
MLILTEDAVLVCKHRGKVGIEATQHWVTVKKKRSVLVETNPEARPISGCPNRGPGIKPCLTTLPVKKGYSDLLRIDGKRVCLDTVTGLTDGTPPGIVEYIVQTTGQDFVSEVG